MKPHRRIIELLGEAQRADRCAIAPNSADHAALLRRAHNGEIANPYRGLFADAGYWSRLDPSQQALHMARTLTLMHPRWVFAGPTAAAIHRFEHPWSIHGPGLYIADDVNGSGMRHNTRLHRVYMPSIPMWKVDGMRVTSAARTLVDCGLLLPFTKALAIFDSAFRMTTVTDDEVMAICAGMRRDCTDVERLLAYTDAHSDNGGESLIRGVMIEEGFAAPELQQVFADPENPSHQYRVDFMWRLPDGRIVVAEYDGMTKYVDPAMTDRRSIKAVVNQQTQRERCLLAWGVNAIIRLDYDDAVNRASLVGKLLQIGVPRRGTA